MSIREPAIPSSRERGTTRHDSGTVYKPGVPVELLSSTDEAILALQRAAGNVAVARLLGNPRSLAGLKAKVSAPHKRMGSGSPSAVSQQTMQRLRYEGQDVPIGALNREEARRFTTMIMENEVAQGDMEATLPHDLVYSAGEEQELERLSIQDVTDPRHPVSFQSTYSELDDPTYVVPSTTDITMVAPMRVRVRVRGRDPAGGQPVVAIAPIQNLMGCAIVASYRGTSGQGTLDRTFRIEGGTLDALAGSIYTDPPQALTLNKPSFDELHFRDTPTVPLDLRVQVPGHGYFSLVSARGQSSFVVWIVGVVGTYRFILERFKWFVQWDVQVVDNSIENRTGIQSAGTVTEPAEPIISGPVANDAFGNLEPTDRLW